MQRKRIPLSFRTGQFYWFDPRFSEEGPSSRAPMGGSGFSTLGIWIGHSLPLLFHHRDWFAQREFDGTMQRRESGLQAMGLSFLQALLALLVKDRS
ncbi:hypothetical protein chiPu_0028145 [Chiloscyllium punctatum]|uniref:Uncharacterized protein n=1 Tax=Chiloscyllium punctatum TaxID=137246 RepID=A0A401TN35_CHIPU|nr:hypothetical protein [Chiloscyllium punctatum]